MTQVVLVTGVAGFIGSHLVERLVNLGNRVIGLDNFDDAYSPSIKRNNIRALEGIDSFRLIEGDIRDIAFLSRVFEEHGIDVVVHLAARAGVRSSIELPVLYEDVNIKGTINLLEVSRACRVKQLVFASSSSVYGLNGNAPFSEEAKVDYPLSPYAASKAAGELFCRTYSHLYHLPIVALRLFTVYGPRQRPEMAIHRFVRAIEQGEEITLFGDGTSKRDYTYVDDIVAGFEATLSCNSETFQIFNLGRGEPVELLSLIRLIEETLGKRARIKYLPPQPGDVPVTLADNSKANAIIGYEPHIDITQGIPRFVRWYLGNKELAL